MAERERFTPYQSKDPCPTIPTYREKEDKRKTVEVKKGSDQIRIVEHYDRCTYDTVS